MPKKRCVVFKRPVWRKCGDLPVISEMSLSPFKLRRKRYKMKKALNRIRKKIRNRVDDLHRKLAKWLCERYRLILLPEFETQRMTARATRKIRSKTARSMCTWSHYRFRMHLINKAREYPGCRVILCDEPLTSKTCGRCGKTKKVFGETYSCDNCGGVFDRDANGARNILLRYMSLNKLAC